MIHSQSYSDFFKRPFAPLILVLVAALMAVSAYLQTLSYPFISDDLLCIVNNKELAELQLSGLGRLLVGTYSPTFEFLPLRNLSLWLDMALFGQNPSAFRLHNILLYLLCLPLIYAASASLWRYFCPTDVASAQWAAAAITALFALHPALIESVVWISGRKYILPNFFSMLSIWLAVKVKQGNTFSSQYALATLAVFVAVMFSKSSYVGVAPLIALLWLIFWLDLSMPQRCRSLLLWPLAILFLAVFLLLIFIVKNNGADTVPFYLGIEALARSLAVLGGLTRIAVSPEPRHFYYPVFEDPWLPAMVMLGALVLCASAWGMIRLLRHRSLAGFAIAAFLFLCLPYLQLIPGKPPSLVADRYVALVIWPVIFLLVLFAWRLKPLLRVVFLLCFAVPWLYQTLERPRDWRSDEALVDTEFRAHPEYFVPAYYKITHQLRDGLHAEASKTASRVTSPEIRNVFTKLIEADKVVHVDAESGGSPREAIILLQNLGNMLEQRPAKAAWDTPLLFTWSNLMITVSNEWQVLAREFPNNMTVRLSAGQYLFRLSFYADAATHLRVVTESQNTPEYVRGTAFRTLGLALLGNRQIAEAESPLRKALEQSPPDLQAYCALSEVYKLEGRFEESALADTQCLGINQRQAAGK